MSRPLPRPALASLAALGLLLGAAASAHAEGPAAARAVSPQSAAPQARFESVRKAIRETLQEARVPSIAVAVVKDGRILWEEGFGWADVERQVPATPHTAYALASMTKPITATAVMTLQEAGRLDLDAPIERYLGGLKLRAYAGRAEDVTARRIMAHAAGLPQYGNFYLDGARPAGSADTIPKFAMIVFPPNTRFEYSNIGMKMLDAAIEEVSGLSYGEYLHRKVFAPLGMNDASVGLPEGRPAATRYDEDRKPMRIYLTDHPGSGDVWASAHDMARFLAFHMGAPLPSQATVLSDATRLQMQRPSSASPAFTPAGAEMGANWILNRVNGHPQVWHSGGQPGVSTYTTFYPDQKLAIVLLANSSAPLGPIAQAIRKVAAPEIYVASDDEAPPPSAPIPFTGKWTGVATSYAGEQTLSLDFREGGAIAVQLADQPATTLARAAFESGALVGRIAGRSNIPEAQRAPHQLALKLVPVNGELVGQLVAQGRSGDTVFMLPSFVRLRPAP